MLVKDPSIKKTIFVPEQPIWLKFSGDMCPILNSTQSKFERKILRCSRVILRLRVKTVGVRASLISPPDLMIESSGWCQNVANTCRYNLTEPDFLKFCLFIFPESFFGKIGKMRANFSDFFSL